MFSLHIQTDYISVTIPQPNNATRTIYARTLADFVATLPAEDRQTVYDTLDAVCKEIGPSLVPVAPERRDARLAGNVRRFLPGVGA